MKKKVVLILIVTGVSLAAFASLIVPYNNAKPPSLTLPAAYDRAVTALGPATNQFHCISANVETSFGPDGEWRFTFYSTNSKPKWVTVEFNGKVHVEDILLR